MGRQKRCGCVPSTGAGPRSSAPREKAGRTEMSRDGQGRAGTGGTWGVQAHRHSALAVGLAPLTPETSRAGRRCGQPLNQSPLATDLVVSRSSARSRTSHLDRLGAAADSEPPSPDVLQQDDSRSSELALGLGSGSPAVGSQIRGNYSRKACSCSFFSLLKSCGYKKGLKIGSTVIRQLPPAERSHLRGGPAAPGRPPQAPEGPGFSEHRCPSVAPHLCSRKPPPP